MVDDVDTVRELLPRVVLPPLTAVAVAAAAVTGIALLLPAALPAVIAAALLSLVAAPALALAADRMSAGTEQRLRSGVLRQVTAALDARAELHANSVSAPVLAAITSADRSATAASQRSAWAEGLGQGLTVLACGTAALASAVLAAPLALSGAVDASTVAVVVLLQLALVEPYAAITTAVRQYPALRAVLERIGEAGVLDDDKDGPSGGLVPVAGRTGGKPGIELRNLAAAWPGGPRSSPGSPPPPNPGAGSPSPGPRAPESPPCSPSSSASSRPQAATSCWAGARPGARRRRTSSTRRSAATCCWEFRRASAGMNRRRGCGTPWPPWASGP